MKIKLNGNQATIYQLFCEFKKLTDLEISTAIKINPNSVRPCRLALERKKLITRTGKKKCHTINGRKAYYSLYEIVDGKSVSENSQQLAMKKELQKLQKQISQMLESLS
jgi:transcription initiation factor IIE alpha subunit